MLVRLRTAVLSTTFVGLIAFSMQGVSQEAIAKVYEIRAAHGASSKSTVQVLLEIYKKIVARKSNGQVKILIFGDRKLGGDKDVLLGIRAGTIDSGLVSSALFSLIVRKSAFDALQLPFLVPTYELQSKMLTSKPAQNMLASLEDVGIKGLGFGEAGLRHFLSSKQPVRQMKDFGGLKTRIVPIPLHKAIWQEIGTSPVGVAFGQIFTSLQTGIIDAGEFNAETVITENLFEHAKYFSLTGHYFWPLVLIHNKNKFDNLPMNIRKILIEAGHEATIAHLKYAKNREARMLETLRSKGVRIFRFEQMAKLRERVSPIIAKWAKRHPTIAEYVALARKLRLAK